MDYSVFSKAVIGYKNRVKHKSSQDYIYYKEYNDHISVSIADGHGVDRCRFSHRGSEFASKACVHVFDYIFNEMKNLELYDIVKLLESNEYKEYISIKVHEMWKESVYKHFTNKIPNVYKIDYILYGTTLIGALITDKFNLYLQIGDGDILEYENGKFDIITYDKKSNVKGVINSMYLNKAYEYIQIKYKLNDESSKKSVILFSDGYTNSFKNNKELFINTESTILNYNKNVFTKHYLIKEYDKYLDYLAINKSKDDISIIYII